jgi:hypothetical protein
MPRPTLEEIFSEPDEFGLLAVKAAPGPRTTLDRDTAILREVEAFVARHGRHPEASAVDHDEMRLATILEALRREPLTDLVAADRSGLLAMAPLRSSRGAKNDWRAEPDPQDVPDSLDDILDDDDLDIDPDAVRLSHVTPAAQRETPEHRADFVPCRDFASFRSRFDEVQAALDAGERRAVPVRRRSIIEPLEGDVFIRGGLLALIAEKSEMSARGGDRDHRLRVVFSNGLESDPLMSSFRKSLGDDPTARMVERSGFGPLDPDWEADRLDLSGRIYVARSLSDDPEIAPQRAILHKIGVTSQDVRRRVADARNDPTFLLAPVEIVATYDLVNLPRRQVEDLLHRFFEPARPGQLFIVDRFGKKVFPREWFYVLPEHVGQAAKLISEGTLHLYRYNPGTQSIIAR